MSVPTKAADKAAFNKFCIVMKSAGKGDVETMHHAVRANHGLLKWVDTHGHTLLHIGILHGAGIDKISALLGADRSIAEVHARGRLPLHILLDHSPTVDVIQRLIDAYPHALLVPDHVTDGRIPLHVVLESTPFPAVYVQLAISMLHRAPQTAAIRCHDKTPLEICLDQGLQPKLTITVLLAHRGSASFPSREGKLPLHHAVELNADPRVIRDLLQAYPEALMIPMKVSGTEMNVLEFAIRNRRSAQIIHLLMNGGNGQDPKAVAFARAVVLNKITQYSYMASHRHKPLKDVAKDRVADKGAVARQRKKFEISLYPEAGDSMKMEVLPDDTITHLKTRISLSEQIPLEKIRLLYTHPSHGTIQLMEGHDLQSYGITNGAAIQLRQRFTLLRLALRNQADLDIKRKLLNWRPESAAEDDQFGVLPLQLAMQNFAEEAIVLDIIDNYPEAAKKELNGAASGEYPLHLALKNKYSKDVISKLLDGSAESDWHRKPGAYLPEPNRAAGSEIECPLPLHLAIQHGTSAESIIEIVNLLLEKRCPVEVRDPITCKTALDACLARDAISFSLFEYILRAISAVAPGMCEESGPNGQTPLHMAVAHKANQAIIEMLCSRDVGKAGGNSLLTYDVDGRLPIHLAVAGGASFALVRTLLSHCPESITKTDGQGRTPLLIAVTHNAQPGVVFEITRTNKQTLQQVDSRGRTLIELACAYDAPQWVVQELLEASPQDALNLNLLSGKWPNTKASAEAMRFVKEAQKRAKRKIMSGSSDTLGNMRSLNSQTSAQAHKSLDEGPVVKKEESSSIFGGWFGGW